MSISGKEGRRGWIILFFFCKLPYLAGGKMLTQPYLRDLRPLLRDVSTCRVPEETEFLGLKLFGFGPFYRGPCISLFGGFKHRLFWPIEGECPLVGVIS